MEETFTFDSRAQPVITVELLVEISATQRAHSELLAVLLKKVNPDTTESIHELISERVRKIKTEVLSQYWAKHGPDLGSSL